MTVSNPSISPDIVFGPPLTGKSQLDCLVKDFPVDFAASKNVAGVCYILLSLKDLEPNIVMSTDSPGRSERQMEQ